MADIELVIKIPEEDYDYLYVRKEVENQEISYYNQLILDGMPLPKGHGRLIDADALVEKLHKYTEAPYQYALTVFNEAPTIVESEVELWQEKSEQN